MKISEQVPWTRLPLILPETGPARAQIAAWLKARRLKPEIPTYVSGNEAILSMASLGLGVGIVPRLVVEHASTAIHVRYLENGPILDPYTIALCTRRQKKDNPITAVLRRVAAETFPAA
jgi:LysR family positive regulator for ilvC